MSVDFEWKKKAQEGRMERVSFNDLPDEIKARVTAVTTGKDTNGKDVIFISVDYDGKPLKFKYGRGWWNDLAIAFEKLGFRKASDTVGKVFKWKKQEARFFTQISTRYLPIEWLGE